MYVYVCVLDLLTLHADSIAGCEYYQINDPYLTIHWSSLTADPPTLRDVVCMCVCFLISTPVTLCEAT